MAATFLVAGYRTDSTHTVRLVPAADLDAVRSEFNPVTGVHCFAVAPAARHGGGTGAAALWSGDAADEATLYDAAVAGGDNALVDGRCSAVECPGLVRVARPVKSTKAAPPPPPPAAKPAVKPPPPAAKKPAPEKKGGGIAAQIKRAAAAAPKRPAPAAADGSDSDGRVRAGRRSVPRVDSSDDEEPAPLADPYAEEEGVPSPSPTAATAARVAGAAPKKRKVTRTTINENGEEVTEEVWEDGGGGDEPAAPPPPPRKAASPAVKKRASPAPKGPVAPAKGQTKAAAAKGTKNIASFFSRKK